LSGENSIAKQVLAFTDHWLVLAGIGLNQALPDEIYQNIPRDWNLEMQISNLEQGGVAMTH